MKDYPFYHFLPIQTGVQTGPSLYGHFANDLAAIERAKGLAEQQGCQILVVKACALVNKPEFVEVRTLTKHFHVDTSSYPQ